MNGKNGLLLFLAGAIVGGAAVCAARDKDVRRLAVKALGKGLRLKDEAAAIVESLKEGVEDLFAEAAADNAAPAAPKPAKAEKAPKARKPRKDRGTKRRGRPAKAPAAPEALAAPTAAPAE